MKNSIAVTIREKCKPTFYDSNNIEVKEGDKVVVKTDNGERIGTVILTDVKVSESSNLDSIVRKATKEDISNDDKNKKIAKEALKKAKEIAEKNKLNMNIIEASFNLDSSQLLFLFLSDTRIDFRDMAKELASIYKTRIELRQIGARDKAKCVSGLGPCGRELCCSSYCSESMEAVSINMAKNQNLALNPSKINGLCGRLLCCLKYEDDIYTENKSKLPSVGDIVNTKNGKGEVVSLNVLKKSYMVNIENEGIVEVFLED